MNFYNKGETLCSIPHFSLYESRMHLEAWYYYFSPSAFILYILVLHLNTTCRSYDYLNPFDFICIYNRIEQGTECLHNGNKETYMGMGVYIRKSYSQVNWLCTNNCSMCNVPVSETACSVWNLIPFFVALRGYRLHTQVFIFLSSTRFISKALNETVKYLTAFLNHATENSILKFSQWQILGL